MFCPLSANVQVKTRETCRLKSCSKRSRCKIGKPLSNRIELSIDVCLVEQFFSVNDFNVAGFARIQAVGSSRRIALMARFEAILPGLTVGTNALRRFRVCDRKLFSGRRWYCRRGSWASELTTVANQRFFEKSRYRKRDFRTAWF